MSFAAAVAAAKQAAAAGDAILDSIKTGGRIYRFIDAMRHGNVTIVHPRHLAMVDAPKAGGWINISGTHKEAKGKYWLLTVSLKEDKYWIHGAIDLKPGGQWEESINVNSRPGPRSVVLCLVRLDSFADCTFLDIKRRARAANDHDSVHIIGIPNKSFRVVQALTLNIP